MLFGTYPFFFPLVAGLCFSSWGLSARTGLCSVLARCPCPGWAALAGADSQNTLLLLRHEVLMGLFSAESGAEHGGLAALSTAAKRAVQTPVVAREPFVVM